MRIKAILFPIAFSCAEWRLANLAQGSLVIAGGGISPAIKRLQPAGWTAGGPEARQFCNYTGCQQCSGTILCIYKETSFL